MYDILGRSIPLHSFRVVPSLTNEVALFALESNIPLGQAEAADLQARDKESDPLQEDRNLSRKAAENSQNKRLSALRPPLSLLRERAETAGNIAHGILPF